MWWCCVVERRLYERNDKARLTVERCCGLESACLEMRRCYSFAPRASAETIQKSAAVYKKKYSANAAIAYKKKATV